MVLAVVDDGMCDAVEMMDPVVGMSTAGEQSADISTVANIGCLVTLLCLFCCRGKFCINVLWTTGRSSAVVK